MKTYNYLVIILIVINCSCSNPDFQGSDSIIAVTRDLPEFTKVKTQNDLDVHISYGDVQNVVIEVNDNLQSNLKTEVANNTLNIFLADGSYSNASFTIDIKLPYFERLQLNDNTRGTVNYITEQLEFEVKGSSKLTLYGSSDTLKTILRDAGRLEGYNFNAHHVNTISRDASELRITCVENINGSIEQASKVFYKGQPDINIQFSENGQLIDAN